MCEGKDSAEELQTLRNFRDPARCYYKTCALVGASGTLLGARLGKLIDSGSCDPHQLCAGWAHGCAPRALAAFSHADMDCRHWLAYHVARHHHGGLRLPAPLLTLLLEAATGHGAHDNMSGIPRRRCGRVVPHADSALVNGALPDRTPPADLWSSVVCLVHDQSRLDGGDAPLLLRRTRNQKTLSTGMTAIAFASRMCGEVKLFGFGNGSCHDTCYHYYDCGPTAGSAGVNQSTFLTSPRASGGFHNFSAQAMVLRQMAAEGAFEPHWGNCARSLGNPPPGYANQPGRAGRPRRHHRHGRGGGSGRGGRGKSKKRHQLLG